MKFYFNSSQILDSIQKMQKVVSSKNVLPILDCFFISVTKEYMDVTAANSDMRLTARIPLESSDGEANFCINAAKFVQTLKVIEGDIMMDYKESNNDIKIKYKNGNIKLVGEDVSTYPQALQPKEDAKSIKVSAKVISSAYAHVNKFIAKDELRPIVNGIYMETFSDKVDFVATNGQFLSVFSVQQQFTESVKVVFPSMFIPVFMNLIDKDEDVTLIVDSSKLYFKCGNVRGYTIQIEGRYPNYKSVIPPKDTLPNVAKVDVSDLKKAMKTIDSFASENNFSMLFKFRNGYLDLSVQDIDYSKAADVSMPIEYIGEEFKILLDIKMLEHVLNSTDAYALEFYMRNAETSISFYSEYEEELFILVPKILHD